MSVGKNYLYSVGYQALTIVLPFVTTPYVSRVMGPESIGAVSYASGVAGYFSLFASLGMATYAVRTISRVREDVMERSRQFWSLWLCQLATSIFASLFYVGYLAAISSDTLGLAPAYLVPIASCALDVSWFFYGCEDFRVVTMRNTLVRLASVAATFAFVRGPEDLLVYVFISVLGTLASQISLWPHLRGRIVICRVSWQEVLSHLRPNLRLFVPVVAYGLYTSSGRVILGAMVGYEQAAYFDYADKMARMPQAAVNALSAVMLPHLSALSFQGDPSRESRVLHTSFRLMMTISIGFAFGMIGIAPSAVEILLGDQYAAVVPALAIMSLIMPLVSSSSVLGYQYLLSHARDRAYSLSLVLGALVELPLALISVPRFGVLGAVASVVAAEAVVLLAQVVATRGEVPYCRWLSQCLPQFVFGALMCVAIRWVGAFDGSPLTILGFQIVVGMASYALMTCVYGIALNDELLRRVVESVVGRLR